MSTARWSYLAVEVGSSWTGTLKAEKIQEELNKHGAKGWELISTVANVTATVLVFKKPA